MSLRQVEKYTFLFMIFCLPFNVGAFYTHLLETDLILLFDVLLALLYVLWFVNSNGFARPPLNWGKVSLPFALFLIWMLLSATAAISLTMLGAGVFMAIKAYLVYLYVVNNVRTKLDLQRVMLMLCIGLAFQGFLGLVQYTTGSSLGLGFLGAISKVRQAGVTRVRGTFGLPNKFGAWLALVIPIAASLFLFEVNGRKKLFFSFATFFGILALLLSFSRSAWAGLLGSSGIMILLLARRRLLKGRYVLGILLAVVVVVVLVVVFWDTIVLRFETGATGKWRLVMMDIALDLIAENPLFGVGLMNYRFHQIELFKFWRPVHNTYLRLGSEVGLPGLFFFLMIIYLTLREGHKMLRCRDRLIFASALGLVSSMWAFLFTVNFGPEYHHYRIKFLFWVVIGLVFSLRNVYRHTVMMQKARAKQPQTPPAAPQVQPQTHGPARPGAQIQPAPSPGVPGEREL